MTSDIIDDLETVIAGFTPGNVTSLTVDPTIVRGRQYDSKSESSINVLNYTTIFSTFGTERFETYTLSCELQINLGDSSTTTVMEECVKDTLKEIDDVFKAHNKAARTFDIELYTLPNYLNDQWITPITISMAYDAVAL